jgi:tyrosyl-tRNA synthetase
MDAITELLSRGVENIYPSKTTLEKVLRSGKKLRLYQGFDPSGIQLHIGHMTGLMKLRQFQNLGHHVIFLIGDGTGQAGDPSGKTRTRDKFLSNEELRNNAKDYVLQAAKIIRFEGDNAAEILYNGGWLNKLTLNDILNIAGHFSLQQLEERDLYADRKKQNQEINFREFMYPLLQGYDSVAMNVDLELGGSDQIFNMLAGRKLVKEILGKEKFVMTTPLLTDVHGNKIGKTEGNVIALTSAPNDLFGMIMNLPDEVITKCFEYITDIPMNEVQKIAEAIKNGVNPMEYKKKLAFTLVRMLNNEDQAKEAQEYFENTFQKKELPDDVKEFVFDAKKIVTVSDLLINSQMVPSKSEAKRLISQGAVEYNSVRLTDPNGIVTIVNNGILRVGKHRFIKTVKNG